MTINAKLMKKYISEYNKQVKKEVIPKTSKLNSKAVKEIFDKHFEFMEGNWYRPVKDLDELSEGKKWNFDNFKSLGGKKERAKKEKPAPKPKPAPAPKKEKPKPAPKPAPKKEEPAPKKQKQDTNNLLRDIKDWENSFKWTEKLNVNYLVDLFYGKSDEKLMKLINNIQEKSITAQKRSNEKMNKMNVELKKLDLDNLTQEDKNMINEIAKSKMRYEARIQNISKNIGKALEKNKKNKPAPKKETPKPAPKKPAPKKETPAPKKGDFPPRQEKLLKDLKYYLQSVDRTPFHSGGSTTSIKARLDKMKMTPKFLKELMRLSDGLHSKKVSNKGNITDEYQTIDKSFGLLNWLINNK